VNNLFDRQSPTTSYNNPLYDMIGRNYSLGVKARF
jgi:outer membrane receptor protein involved in Fe transport